MGFRCYVDSQRAKTFRVFYLSTLVSVFWAHLAIADKHAGLAPSVLAGVVRMLSHRCCLERPPSKLFQPQASLSTQPSAINFRVLGVQGFRVRVLVSRFRV